MELLLGKPCASHGAAAVARSSADCNSAQTPPKTFGSQQSTTWFCSSSDVLSSLLQPTRRQRPIKIKFRYAAFHHFRELLLEVQRRRRLKKIPTRRSLGFNADVRERGSLDPCYTPLKGVGVGDGVQEPGAAAATHARSHTPTDHVYAPRNSVQRHIRSVTDFSRPTD